MTNLVSERQRAERFAQLLDKSGSRRRRHLRTNVDEQLTDLLAISGELGGLSDAVAIDQNFKVDLRAQLMAMAERDGIGVTAVEPEVERAQPDRGGTFGLRGRAKAAVLVGLIVGTLAVSGLSAASDNAVPGDSLYSLKRQTENAQLAIAGSNISRGQLYLGFAKTRAHEAQKVHNDAGALRSLLTDMDNETYLGVRLLTTAALERHDAAPLNAVSSFVASQKDAVRALKEMVPAESLERVTASLDLLDRAEKRALDLRNTLHCPNASTATDRLGPLAGTCVASGDAPTRLLSGGGLSSGTSTGASPGQVPGAAAGASTSPDQQNRTEKDGGVIDQLGRLLGGLLVG